MSFIDKKANELKQIIDDTRSDSSFKEKFLSFIKTLNHSNSFREKLVNRFEELYPEVGGIIKIIDDKIEGKIKEFLKMLFIDKVDLAANRIINAFGSFTIKEEPIYEMLFNYPKWLKEQIQIKFKEKSGVELLEQMEANFPNSIKQNLFIFLSNERINPNIQNLPNKNLCEDFAKLLSKEKDWMSNKKIMKIFSQIASNELVLTSRDYKKLTGKNIFEEIENLPEAKKKFMLNLFYYTICPPQKYANLFNEALKIKDDDTIYNILINRENIDFDLFTRYYQKAFHIYFLDDMLRAGYEEEFCSFLKEFFK